MQRLFWILTVFLYAVAGPSAGQSASCPNNGKPVFGVIPATPSASQQFTITVGAPGYQAMSAAATVQGNWIYVALTAVPVFFGEPPPTSCSTTAPVGPVPAGSYTVILSVLVPLGPPASPVFIALTSLTVATEVQDFSVMILPSNPVILQPVVARLVTSQTCLVDSRTLRLSQNGSTIRIDAQAVPPCISTSGPVVTQDVSLGQFPPGNFDVVLFFTRSTPTQVVSAHFSVADTYPTKTGQFPLVNYTDHWWNSLESGWGLSIMQHPSDRLFAVWFVYNQTGQPVWYTLQPGTWTGPTIYTGLVYKTTGPYYGGPFDPRQVGITQVGTATLSFTDSNSGTFSYTVEGVTGSKSITRLPF